MRIANFGEFVGSMAFFCEKTGSFIYSTQYDYNLEREAQTHSLDPENATSQMIWCEEPDGLNYGMIR